MNTRSQTMYEKSALYTVDIDFENASKAWRQNKKHDGQGQFKYVCAFVKKDGSRCNKNLKTNEYCFRHQSKE
jgi:hypothetical protein